MAAADTVTAEAYLIVEATRHGGTVTRARVIGTRKGRPVLHPDQATVRVRLRLPVRVFDPVRITADVDVDADALAALYLVPGTA